MRDSIACNNIYVPETEKDTKDTALWVRLPTVQVSKSELKLDHLPIDQRHSLTNLLKDYSTMFSDIPGRTSLAVHTIRLKPGTKPIRLQPYTANPIKREIIKREIEDMLKMGIIWESSSPWALPILLVEKPDQLIRFTIDFRRVNAVSDLDAFPLS